MNIRTRGISYHFNLHQNNPDLPNLLLLHGFLGSGNIFNHLIPALKTFSNPITIDLLGHGDTEGAELHYRFSTNEQVLDLSKLISEQINGPVFLYGYSMGARLALQLSIRKPELLQGLILESGTFGIESETERQARQALDAARADLIMGNFEDFLEDWKNKPLFQTSLSDEKLALIHQIQENQNPIWIANSLLAFGTGSMPYVRKEIANLKCSTKLIVGELDAKFVQINQTMNREIPDCSLSIIESSNHRVHLEQPEKSIQVIKEFITNHLLP